MKPLKYSLFLSGVFYVPNPADEITVPVLQVLTESETK